MNEPRANPAQPQGYVALLAVLIVSAAGLAIALALLLGGVNNQRSTLVTQESTQARGLATACAEEALQELHDDPAFIGTNSLTSCLGDCAYAVTSVDSTNRIIDTTGLVKNTVRKIKIHTTITTSSIKITSWQEVN